MFSGPVALVGDVNLRRCLDTDQSWLDDVAHELLCQFELTQGLLEVDDVDPVALREDEAAHLGIPAARLVSEMDAGGQQFFEGGLVV